MMKMYRKGIKKRTLDRAVGDAVDMIHKVPVLFHATLALEILLLISLQDSLVATRVYHSILTARKMLPKRRFDCFQELSPV
jgi:hypothetical protein